jgi:hypothetical protein
MAGGACILWLTGCGEDGGQDEGRAAAEAAGEQAGVTIALPGDSVAGATVHTQSAVDAAFQYSREGRFRIIWPPGCSQVRTKSQVNRKVEGEPIIMAHVFCDRQDMTSEGCAVTAYFDEQSDFGGPPTPRNVTELIKKILLKMRVEITTQRPLRRGSLEGLQVLGQQPDGDGAVWIEGLLLGDVIYLLSAWSTSGDPFLEPVYHRFFDSFQIWPEPAE